jgi:glycosyltransferase involved in cell wall biosynthesis
MNPVISIVTGTWNRLPLLQKFIQSCRESVPVGIAIDFIVVDGGSTDGTLDWLATQSDIHTIAHGELRGAIPAFTEGATAAKGKYVVLGNDDVLMLGDSLTRALIHLEENPKCGAVAFADNRMDRSKRQVWQIPVVRNGVNTTAVYAQVGMYRRWLGDACGWWTGNEPTFDARTYAGDSMLSAKIWEKGYSVDAVDGVAIEDHIYEDELRVINRGDPSKQEGGHPDSKAYYKIYPNGPIVAPTPTLPNPDKTQLRILYLPIFEQDRDATGEYTQRCKWQHEQKNGLRKALQRKGALVYEIDYLAYHREPQRLMSGLLQVLDLFAPHMILTQLHGTDVLNADMIATIRQHCPRVFMANWNGDVYPAALKSKPMLDALRFFDLQLVVNAGVIPFYEQHGIPCAYWQCAAEEPEGELPDVSKWDVLFLGSNYSEYRGQFADFLRTLGIPKLGLYGLNWGADGNPDCTYDFLTGTALYRNAKIALGENQYLENAAFVSNRLWEALHAGGALLLHQRVNDLEKYTGLRAGEHYIEWETHEDLARLIPYWLDPTNQKARKLIVKAGKRFVDEHHSFDARVRDLFTNLLPIAKRKMTNTVALQYIGRSDSAGGISVNGRNYVHEGGRPLVVDALDAPEVLRRYPNLFAEMGAAQGDRVASAVEAMR